MYCNKRHLVDEPLIPCVPPGYSYVRFFHSLPQLEDIYIYINGSLRSSRLQYLSMTYYVPFIRGRYDIQVYSAQSNTLIFELKDFEIIGGQILTFAGAIDDRGIRFLPIIDDVNEGIDPDEAKIRFFNIDGDNIIITLASNGYIMTRELAYATGTEYMGIVPGDYKLEISRVSGSGTPLSLGINIKPGRIYTVYTVGSLLKTDPNYAQASIIQILQTVDGNTILMKCKF